MNVNKAHGPDEISAHMIKLCANELCEPLRIIFQNIIDTGIFPDQWKEANVTPVHKKKDKKPFPIIGRFRFFLCLPKSSRELCSEICTIF